MKCTEIILLEFKDPGFPTLASLYTVDPGARSHAEMEPYSYQCKTLVLLPPPPPAAAPAAPPPGSADAPAPSLLVLYLLLLHRTINTYNNFHSPFFFECRTRVTTAQCFSFYNREGVVPSSCILL